MIGYVVFMLIVIKIKGYDSSFYDFILIYFKKDEVDEKYEKIIEVFKKWFDEMDY